MGPRGCPIGGLLGNFGGGVGGPRESPRGGLGGQMRGGGFFARSATAGFMRPAGIDSIFADSSFAHLPTLRTSSLTKQWAGVPSQEVHMDVYTTPTSFQCVVLRHFFRCHYKMHPKTSA